MGQRPYCIGFTRYALDEFAREQALPMDLDNVSRVSVLLHADDTPATITVHPIDDAAGVGLSLDSCIRIALVEHATTFADQTFVPALGGVRL